MNRLDITPDFIYIDYLSSSILKKKKPISGLKHVTIPKGALFEDLHRNRDLFRRFVNGNGIDLVFARYRDPFLSYYPEFEKKLSWLPHHVYPSVYMDYRLDKTIDYLMMGSIRKRYYPVRRRIFKGMRQRSGFVYQSIPGFAILLQRKRKKAM